MLKEYILVFITFSLFTVGCATQSLSTSERAFSSCFVSDNTDGWSFSAEPPENKNQLKKLIKRGDDESLPGSRDYWFNHEDGRKMLCVISPFGEPPVYCSGITYQLKSIDGGWVVDETTLILCHLKP